MRSERGAELVGGKAACGACGERLAPLWLEPAAAGARAVCAACAALAAARGRCARGCDARAWCAHGARCLACGFGGAARAGGCAACRLSAGDGEDVAALADALDAAVVFCDFDRTLASTRAGAATSSPSLSLIHI